MSSSDLIPKIAEAFGLDDRCMQKVLRVEEGEYRLWKLDSKHIPEREHLNILALHVIGESWISAGFQQFNAKIHEPLFSGISVFSTLCSSGVDRGQILFLGRALLLDSATPPKVSNTTLENMEEWTQNFKDNCPSDIRSGDLETSDMWVDQQLPYIDEPGRLFAYMVFCFLKEPRSIFLKALLKGIARLDHAKYPGLTEAIMMASLHPDYSVQEWVVGCADGSDDPVMITVLESMKPNAEYVGNYLDIVLDQLKRQVAKDE